MTNDRAFKRKCIRPECDNPHYSRGLCEHDFHVARRLILKGITTWASLEKNGKSLTPHGPGRPPSEAKAWLLEGAA